ncbi:MAG: Hpt domain-containing protein [Gammaproteobacteria bacterium]|nr:Hpt domain-containing protein [Gammaproteobacteria bacterium]
MTDSVIDAEIFNEVRDLMEDAMDKFIATFVDNTPKIIQQIADGLESGDIESLHLSAHQLKGGSSSIGAMALSEIAFKIEQAGKAGDTGKIPELIAQLREAYQAVEAELKRLDQA